MIASRLENAVSASRFVLRTGFLAGVAVLLVVTSTLANDDPIFFYSGDQAIPLTKSPNELIVVMDSASVNQTRDTLEANSDYQLEPIPWRPERQDYAILRTTNADLDTRVNIHAIPGVLSVRPIYRFENRDSPMLSTGNLVVKLADTVSTPQRQLLFQEHGVEVVRVLEGLHNVYVVHPVDDPEEDEVRSAMGLHLDNRTVYAHPDFIVAIETRDLPGASDEFINDQWHLHNEGQVGGTPGADINVAEAWELTLGAGVIAGMLDDSVDVDHEELVDNYIGVGFDAFTGETSRLAPIPQFFLDAHGTAVMGLIVGAANEIGIRGVAPAAEFTAARFGLSESQIASAFVFAQQQDVDVHNNSWGFPFTKNFEVPIVVDAIRTAFEEGRNGKGMVILFASGNFGIQLQEDDDLATLPYVIGVGATRADDVVSPLSSFGEQIDVLAPSNILDQDMPGVTTTDVTDGVYPGANGYNLGTGLDIFDNPDFSNPNYTRNFGGTSAACPIATGVAALIVSANPDLTATQVRVIMEQTCDKVDIINADYHGITERSLKYGYGRLNAGEAVQAAVDSAANGDLAWPNRLGPARVSAGRIVWIANDDLREIDLDGDGDIDGTFGDETVRTLVVESNCPFAWTPTDGVDYEVDERVAPSVFVVQNNDEVFFTVDNSTRTKFYGLYPANAIDNYGFGTAIDSDDNVEVVGTDQVGVTPIAPCLDSPRASIDVSPLSGQSPLLVTFKGNALPTDPDNPIVSALWDFGDGSTSNESITTHRYEVTDPVSTRFTATFTVTDSRDQTASRSVAIDVTGEGAVVDVGAGDDIRIVVGIPGSIDSDKDRGDSPFAVNLMIEGLSTSAGTVTSVAWDLGDGSVAETLSVSHTYINETAVPQTFVVSVTVETRASSDTINRHSATRFITVDPSETALADAGAASPTILPQSPASSPVPGFCGAGSGLALIGMLSLALVRRRLR